MIAPSLFLTRSHPDFGAADFVGPARDAAEHLEALAAHALAHNRPPLKLFLSGPPGIGKTALTYWVERLFRVPAAVVDEFNGTDLTIDRLRELDASLHLGHPELYGLYRVISIQEADRVPDVAQVKLLTMLDNLLPKHCVICTTNVPLTAMEERFQRRFKYTALQAPSQADIAGLLRRWDVPEEIVQMIALGACGNVGLALNELDEWLMTEAVRQRRAAAARTAAPVAFQPAFA